MNRLQTTNHEPETNNGFSLLETVVAISILMITIVGPLSLASKGIVLADYVKDEITGFYLAQEAIEMIRNIRDTNVKNGTNWLQHINDCVGVDKICRIEIWAYSNDQKGITLCNQCGDDSTRKNFEKLKVIDIGDKTSSIKLYGYDFPGNIGLTSEDSIFSRRIIITDKTTRFHLSKPGEINVAVEVSWIRSSLRGKDVDRRIQVSENMFGTF